MESPSSPEGDDAQGALTLAGRVVDVQGRPIADAVVSVDSLPPARRRASGDGRFTFEGLAERTYRLHARSSDGLAATRQLLLERDTPDVQLVLEVAAALEVTVVQGLGQEPVPEALVSVEGDLTLSGTTDVRGKVTLNGLVRGRHVISASHEGFAPERVALFEDRGTGTRHLALLLRPGVGVSGQVVDARGAPVADAVVQAIVPSALDVEAARAGVSARSDASGHYRIPALPTGTFRLSAEHQELGSALSEAVQVDAGGREPAPVRLVLQGGGRLTGIVYRASGEPAAGAVVGVRAAGAAALLGARRSARTDAEGAFSVAGLPRSELWVEARLEGAVAQPQSVSLEDGSGDVSLLLESAGVIRGTVASSDGKPLAGAQVAAIPDAAERRMGLGDSRVGQYAADVSDSVGQFQLSGLLPGKYRLHASMVHAVQSSSFWMEAPVLAETGDMNVRLVVSAMARLRAQVTLADGSEPKVLAAALSLAPPMTFAGAGGALLLEDVPPGNHVVSVSAPGFQAHEVDVPNVREGEDRDLGRIVLERGLVLTGTVTGAQGVPAVAARVSAGAQLKGDGRGLGGAVASATTDEQGQFVLEGLKPGSLVVLAEHAELGRSAPVTLIIGPDAAPLALQLESSSRLVGTVTRNGKSVHGAAVVAAPGGSSTVRLAVVTQADGRFRFDSLSTGPHVLTAGLRLSPALQLARRFSVVVGEQQEPLEMDVSTRGPELSLYVPADTTSLVQLHLVSGHVRASTRSWNCSFRRGARARAGSVCRRQEARWCCPG
jgi:protocatechuate 3,4-dioxygenase beta subunit